MSGPQPLTEGDAEQQTLELLAPVLRLPTGRRRRSAHHGLPHAPAPDHAADPVDVLAAELAPRTGPAVHPYEVAAVLESEGITEERIRGQYGHQDIFQLAEDLYRRVPRTHPEPALPPDPWRPDTLRCLLRGLLFAVPGLAYVLGGQFLGGERTLPALVTAALLSWAFSQALSHRAHLRLVAGRAAAARTLLKGAPAAALLAGGAGAVVAGPGAGAVFAGGQSVYLGAAGVLLVLGRERLLALTLLPLPLGVVAGLRFELPVWAVAALCLAPVVLSAGAAARVLRAELPGTRAPGATPSFVASLPYGLFGLAAGVLAVTAGQRQPWAVVVLTLSMGAAEWLLGKFRSLAVGALRAGGTVRGFRLRAGGALLLCLTLYLVPLLAGGLVTGSTTELLALGALFWTALLLQAFGTAWPPALVCAAAAAGALITGRHTGSVLCALAALALLGLAARQLTRPTAHA